MSRRKQASVKVDVKKSAAGKMGKGVDAFIPRKTKKVDALQKRIDLVVANAMKQADQAHDGGDVFRDRLSFFRGSRVRSVKLG
jgi:hypothetical protein